MTQDEPIIGELYTVTASDCCLSVTVRSRVVEYYRDKNDDLYCRLENGSEITTSGSMFFEKEAPPTEVESAS